MAGMLGSLPNVAQTLDSVAKGASFIRDIKEVQEDYRYLSTEIAHIKNSLERAQRISKSSHPDPQVSTIAEELGVILERLQKIHTEVQNPPLDGVIKANRRKWFTETPKIQKLVRNAQNTRAMLLEALQWQILDRVLAVGINGIDMTSQLMIMDGAGRTMHGMIGPLSYSSPAETLSAEQHKIQELVEVNDIDTDFDGNQGIDEQPSAIKGYDHFSHPQTIVENSSVSLGKSISGNIRTCAKGCPCSCHAKPRQYQTPGWIKHLAGSLDARCTSKTGPGYRNTGCKCARGSTWRVDYRPPTWLWKTILSIQAGYTEIGLQFTLRPVRVVPLNNLMWTTLRTSAEHVQDYMRRGDMIYPDDRMESGTEVLADVIFYRKYDVLELLLQMWEDLLSQKRVSRQVWYYANMHLVNSRHTEREKYLLDKVASYVDDEPEMDDGLVDLHDAVLYGCEVQQAISQLVDATAINELDMSGRAPLHNAILYGNVDVVQQLIDAGADVNVKDVVGMTPLMFAARKNDTDCMHRLILAKCRIMDCANSGRTALHFAAGDACVDVVRVLLCHSVSVRVRDTWGYTPLHDLARSRADAAASIKETARLLLGVNGLEIDAKAENGATPAMVALRENNLPLLQCLVQAGCSLMLTDRQPYNLLHYAAKFCNAEMMHFLTSLRLSNIDIHLQTSSGDTPWDAFICCTNASLYDLGNTRPLNLNQQIAFVNLYTGIRNRNLRRDISILQQASDALHKEDITAASGHLAGLAMTKAENQNHEHASFYRAISNDIRAGRQNIAARAIEEDLEHLKDEILRSPWEQKPSWDVYYSDESEDKDDWPDCKSEPEQPQCFKYAVEELVENPAMDKSLKRRRSSSF